jgi:serine protease Do
MVSRLLIGLQLVLIALVSTPLVSCSRSQGTDLPTHGPIYTVAAEGLRTSNADDAISGSRKNAITSAVAKASPAVVGINVTEVREQRVWDPFEDMYRQFPEFFGRRNGNNGSGIERYEVKALGSGFLVSADGYIVTNDHVAGNASKIIVTLSGGVKYDAKLIATDHNSDVSLLKIDGEDHPYVKLGNSDDLSIGEWAIAMGNPFGLFSSNNKPTVTVGVISNTGVSLGIEEGRNYRDMIQTDAAISSGNSGGPLLNANGDVIGMNSTIISTAQGYQGSGSIGLGFAIPVNKVKKLLDGFKSGEKINHNIADLGFHVLPVSSLQPDDKTYFHIKNDEGLVIQDMRRNSLADRAGLQVGDVIVSLDGLPIRDVNDMQSILADHVVGDVAKFKVIRAEKDVDVKVKLEGAAQK